MKKKDWVLIGILLLAAAVLFLWMRIGRQEQGNQIEITIDGETYGVYSLLTDQEIRIEGENGENTIIIEDGQAWMEEADCPDGYCMQQGTVSRVNETIVCLPHKLVVEVQSADGTDDETEDSVDIVVG